MQRFFFICLSPDDFAEAAIEGAERVVGKQSNLHDDECCCDRRTRFAETGNARESETA